MIDFQGGQTQIKAVNILYLADYNKYAQHLQNRLN